MKLSEVLSKYVKNIKEYNASDIYKLVAFSLNMEYNDIILKKDEIDIDNKKKNIITSNLDKYYISKVPLQYITGYQNFFKEKYIVNENVLVPRSDTEILVEEAIKYINKENMKTCIDMCCRFWCNWNIYC